MGCSSSSSKSAVSKSARSSANPNSPNPIAQKPTAASQTATNSNLSKKPRPAEAGGAKGVAETPPNLSAARDDGEGSSGRQSGRRLLQNVVGENIGKDIRDYYLINTKQVLGSGLSGNVVLCQSKITKIAYALKTLSKRSLKQKKIDQLKQEIRIMQDLDHPNIIRLHEYFETDSNIYLISELCTGGELLDRLQKQHNSQYSELTACEYVHAMTGAVAYIHSRNIVHRDLKLENFLFENDTPTSNLKLIGNNLNNNLNNNKKKKS